MAFLIDRNMINCIFLFSNNIKIKSKIPKYKKIWDLSIEEFLKFNPKLESYFLEENKLSECLYNENIVCCENVRKACYSCGYNKEKNKNIKINYEKAWNDLKLVYYDLIIKKYNHLSFIFAKDFLKDLKKIEKRNIIKEK